jgi:hypothetical protein
MPSLLAASVDVCVEMQVEFLMFCGELNSESVHLPA